MILPQLSLSLGFLPSNRLWSVPSPHPKHQTSSLVLALFATVAASKSRR
jgi:hypothetical protein